MQGRPVRLARRVRLGLLVRRVRLDLPVLLGLPVRKALLVLRVQQDLPVHLAPPRSVLAQRRQARRVARRALRTQARLLLRS